ncbi:MAG: hypothetical protein AB8B56_19430, partial [Crocinitomicaceae bacterium]
TISLFYLFIIPNLYGKVNHNHHLIWFPAILAFSPCADRFSLDAFFCRLKNKVVHHSSAHYTLPLAFIWILIGLIYFFPGFWKLWSHGLDWSLTDNVRNHMYYKWFQLSDWQTHWTPFFRIDQYPFFYKASGIFTIIFELSFIPLILNKSTRKVGILIGLLFHIATYAFMNIFFIVLVWSYLSFVNWNSISFLKERGNMSSLKYSEFYHTLVKWIGGGLIVSCILFGFGKWYSYPFTAYPTFDNMVEEEQEYLIYSAKTRSGKHLKLNNDLLRKEFSSERYWEMESRIITELKDNKLLDTNLLEHFIAVQISELDSLTSVSVSIESQSILPEKRLLVNRESIYSKAYNSFDF